MLERSGWTTVLVFYVGMFGAALGLGWVAAIPSIFTTHALGGEDLLLRVAGGALAGGAVALLSQLVGRWWPRMQRVDEVLAGMLGPLDAQEAWMLAGLSGLGEEALFRGALQGILGIGLTSVLFMLAHFPPRRDLWPWTVSAGVAGVGMGLMTLWTGDVVAAVVAHVVVNGVELMRLGHTGAKTPQ